MAQIREFESTTESYFILDGVSYPKVYEAMLDNGYSDTKIKLVGTNRDTTPLVFSTEYTKILVDGEDFDTASEAISRLNQIVFSKGGGSGGGGVIQSLVEGDNINIDSSDPENPIISAESNFPGPPGVDGNTILNSNSFPISIVGKPGDYFIKNDSHQMWGPKIADKWGTPFNIKGETGKSAYELYVFTTLDSPIKTLQQWQDSNKGKDVPYTKKEVNTSSIPTAWTIGNPDLFERYQTYTAGTYANFKDYLGASIVVSVPDLVGNFVFLEVTNGVTKKIVVPTPINAIEIVDPGEYAYNKITTVRQDGKKINAGGAIVNDFSFMTVIFEVPTGATKVFVENFGHTYNSFTAFYDENPLVSGVYISGPYTIAVASGIAEYTVPVGAKYMAIMSLKASLTPSITTDNHFSSFIANPVLIHLKGNRITKETIEESVPLNEIKNSVINTKNLVGVQGTQYRRGYFNVSSKAIAPFGDYRIVFFPIEPNKKYVFSSKNPLVTSMYTGIGFFEKSTDNNTIAFKIGELGTAYRCDVTLQSNHGWKIDSYPDTARFVGISIGSYTDEQLLGLKLQFEEGEVATTYKSRNNLLNIADLIVPPVGASRWTAKNYIAIGDSITDENFTPNIKYPTLMKNILLFSLYTNGASSGMTLAQHGANNNNFARSGATKAYNTVSWIGYDLVTFALGTNDFGYSIPIGNITDVVNTTFYGALNIVLTYMLTQNPQLKIVLFTPFQRTGQDTANGAGSTLNDYRNAIIQAGIKYSCPVVDCYAESGVAIVNSATYTSDGLHLNALGHTYVSGYITGKVKDL